MLNSFTKLLVNPLKSMKGKAIVATLLAEDDASGLLEALESDPNVAVYMQTSSKAMAAAIEAGAAQCCTLLHRSGVGVDGAKKATEGISALDYAARLGKDRCVMSLIKSGAEGSSPASALASAAMGQSEACLRAVMAMPSCRPGAKMEDGSTAFMLAAERGWIAGLKILAPESRPEQKDHFGRTALMRAAMAGSLEGVVALLPVSNPNEQDNRGRNAMFIAAANEQISCVYALMPVSDLAPDANGRTALDVLVNTRHDVAAEMVKKQRFKAMGARLDEIQKTGETINGILETLRARQEASGAASSPGASGVGEDPAKPGIRPNPKP